MITQPFQQLIARLESRQAVIGIVGLGYVGLPLLLRYVEAGYRVIGFDNDPTKPERLSRGETYLKHIPAEVIQAAQAGFAATTDLRQAAECDALILCLPTPLNRHREPDLSFVLNTVEALLPYLHAGQIMALESTTWPGTTDEELKPRLEAAGLTVGEQVALVFSPEREDPGNRHYTTRTIPKVVGGVTPACLTAGLALYRGVIDQVVPVSSARAAELTKLLENIHRAVNIGLVNEMKQVADRMGIDIHEVIDAAATKPFGFVPYRPGPGLGGHCIPIDPFYLTWKAREYGVHTRFIELAGEVNSGMPAWVVQKVRDGLNQRQLAVKGSQILLLGIAYKPNIDDMRESPAVEILQQLHELGAEVAYSDPWVPNFPPMRRYRFNLQSVALTAESLATYDCVVLTTDHDQFDYPLIAAHSRLLVDTRGRYRQPQMNLISA